MGRLIYSPKQVFLFSKTAPMRGKIGRPPKGTAQKLAQPHPRRGSRNFERTLMGKISNFRPLNVG